MPTDTAWWRFDEARLDADTNAITSAFPDLVPAADGAGLGWSGRLPLWPFDRPAPCEFAPDAKGLELLLIFPESYPMSMPSIHPVDPQPRFDERTQHRWHLNGDGSLCFIQDQRTWSGRESVIDLLLKAASWRLEYDLVRSEVVASMSENGIVSDGRRDLEIARVFGRKA